MNPDLIKAGLMTEKKLYNHWIKFGIKEARKCKIKDIASNFNWLAYKNMNPDLEKAGLKTQIDIEYHWFKYGMNEKRIYVLLSNNAIKYIFFAGVHLSNYSKITRMTDFFRGINIVNRLKIDGYIIKYISFMEINEYIQANNSIFILVKGLLSDIVKYQSVFTILKNNHNIIIHDIVDLYAREYNWYVNKKYISFENTFDYLILNSYHMLNTLKNILKSKLKVIYHSYDFRLNPTNKMSMQVDYYGVPEKINLKDTKKYHMYKNLIFNINPSVHIMYVTPNNPYYFNHNTTKIATAMGSNSILVTNNIPIVEEIMGSHDFIAKTEQEFHELVQKALRLLKNKKEYESYLDKVKQIKNKLSPETMVENYKIFLMNVIKLT
jgi:hypothetical protein